MHEKYKNNYRNINTPLQPLLPEGAGKIKLLKYSPIK